MEHKLIQGGEHWLAFARSRIKALRGGTLRYASQVFTMPDGATVRVRISLDQEFIEISGSEGGNYWILPHSDEHTGGIRFNELGQLIPGEAWIKLNAAPNIKVHEHTTMVAGPHDWKGGKDYKLCITYDQGSVQRYSFPGNPNQYAGDYGIFRDGVKRMTTHRVNGAAIANMKYKDENGNDRTLDRVVYATMSANGGGVSDGYSVTVFAVAKQLGDPDVQIGLYDVPAELKVKFWDVDEPAIDKNVLKPVGAFSPVFFNSVGDKFVTTLSARATVAKGQLWAKRYVLRGSITYDRSTDTLTATFALGESVGTDYVFSDFLEWLTPSDVNGEHYVHIQEHASDPNGFWATFYDHRYQENISGAEATMEEVIAIDYAKDDTEIFIKVGREAKSNAGERQETEAITQATSKDTDGSGEADAPESFFADGYQLNVNHFKVNTLMYISFNDDRVYTRNCQFERKWKYNVTTTLYGVDGYPGTQTSASTQNYYVTFTYDCTQYMADVRGIDARNGTIVIVEARYTNKQEVPVDIRTGRWDPNKFAATLEGWAYTRIAPPNPPQQYMCALTCILISKGHEIKRVEWFPDSVAADQLVTGIDYFFAPTTLGGPDPSRIQGFREGGSIASRYTDEIVACASDAPVMNMDYLVVNAHPYFSFRQSNEFNHTPLVHIAKKSKPYTGYEKKFDVGLETNFRFEPITVL